MLLAFRPFSEATQVPIRGKKVLQNNEDPFPKLHQALGVATNALKSMGVRALGFQIMNPHYLVLNLPVNFMQICF